MGYRPASTGWSTSHAAEAAHRASCEALTPADREWLTRMCDELPRDTVVDGVRPGRALMLVHERTGARRWLFAPSGPAGVSAPTRPSPTRGVLR